MTKKMVPEVRFEGYEEEWEVTLLSKLMTFSNGINAPKESYGKGRKMISVLDILDDTPLKYEGIRNSVSVNVDIENRSRVDKGDLVFVRSSEVVSEVGWGKAYLDEKYALYSGFSIRGKRKDKYEALFLELSINETARKQIERRSGGSTRFNVNQSILNELKVAMPSLDEQKEISHIFKILNTNINSRKHELTKLQNFKQAMLQKMFPKEGETVPEVRFEGFSGEWKLNRLKEISNIISGGTPATTNPEYWDGDINWYSPTEIGKSPYTKTSTRKITQLGLEKSSANLLPKDRTVLFTSRAGIGDMAILKDSGATNQGFQSLVLKDDIDAYFIYSMGFQIKKYANKNASGSTFLEISGRRLGEMELRIPSKEEQLIIGSFFKSLDNKIELEEQNLQKLKQFKKAMLQKMFV
ncbi:restriction endonuclease subunit S [Psychrobacillus sp. NPDC096389]|uniref:restriction endonuclease subunit S n=1 Tax=Psychrobacillus sp. NPDC096389 TaxID=3364490 RepID=UPI003821D66D